MVRVIVEDAKDGFNLCQMVNKIYFEPYGIDCNIQSFNGIWNLADTLRTCDAEMDESDVLFIVYDDIMENSIVRNCFLVAQTIIFQNLIEDNVYWIPTNSFEIEIFLIDHIEAFGNKENYYKFIFPLKEVYQESPNLYLMTKYSKSNSVYDEMYEQQRKKKKQVIKYKMLSPDDFENAITIESISKKLLA